MNLKLLVSQYTINKKLSVPKQEMLVPKQVIYLLNAVSFKTNTACTETDGEFKIVSSETDNHSNIVSSGTDNQ